MGTTKSFQDSITMAPPEMVKNIAFPGIFYRINQFPLGGLTVMVRTQVHAEDEEPMLEFEESGSATPIDIEEEGNEEWFNKFRYEIPVFFLDKKFLCKNRIDLDAFNSALEEYHTKSER